MGVGVAGWGSGATAMQPCSVYRMHCPTGCHSLVMHHQRHGMLTFFLWITCTPSHHRAGQQVVCASRCVCVSAPHVCCCCLLCLLLPADLAVVKVDGVPDQQLRPLPLGTSGSGRLRVGQLCLAIGNRKQALSPAAHRAVSDRLAACNAVLHCRRLQCCCSGRPACVRLAWRYKSGVCL